MSRKPRHVKATHGSPPKSKGKPKVVKTDRNAHRPFTLSGPKVFDFMTGESSEELTSRVEAELWTMHAKMMENESHYYGNDFANLVSELAKTGSGRLKGRKNSALRGFLDKAPAGYPDEKHKYNFMEMLRSNIASKLQIYITRCRLEQVLCDNGGASPKGIRQKYIDKFGKDDVPSTSAIKKHLRAFEKNGSIDNVPTASGLLPLSACDGHYRRLINKYKHVIVVLSLSFGKVALVFDKPKNRHRYAGDGRITMPTLRFDEKEHVIHYDFTFTEPRPKKRGVEDVSGMLGIDSGVVNTMVMAYIGKDGTYSQPLLESHRVRNLERQIDGLFEEIGQLQEKARRLDEDGWFDKSVRVLEEAGLKRQKAARLKKQKAVLAAHEAVSAAVALDAGISVEALSWTPESHWDHAFFQEALANLAADEGMPVVRVNAGGTSKLCPHCGHALEERSGRKLHCPECGVEIDRDVIGSRNTGLRGLGYEAGTLREYRYRCVSTKGVADRSHRDGRARRNKSSSASYNQGPCSILDVYDTIFAMPLCLPPGK